MDATAAITFSGSSATDGLSASATFNLDNTGDLIITLENTYSGGTLDQADVLTALFFSTPSGLTPVQNSATASGTGTVSPGGLLWQGGVSSAPPSGAILGQHWEYKDGLSGAPSGANSGISCAGFGIFGPAGNFAAHGQNLGGADYGIVSVGYDGSGSSGPHARPELLEGSLANLGIQNGSDKRPYIQNAMTFELSGFTGSLAAISNVVFQYGSSLDDPSFAGSFVPTAIPEPNYGIILVVSILPLVALTGSRKCSPSRPSPH